MTQTQVVEWVRQPFEGYIMNTAFSPVNAAQLMQLIRAIEAEFGDGVFCMPEASLHITLLDWIAPLVDYDGQDKRQLFEHIRGDYDKALIEIFDDEEPFTVTFDTIQVAPSTIFITGHDNGQYERIRAKFLDKVELLPNTKRPPGIIHSSLARFTKEIDLDQVAAFIAKQKIAFEQPIVNFRLIHTSREPMLEFEVLKTYELIS